MTKEKDTSFEAGLARLEELVGALEDGELDLDRSLAVFEEGVRLSRTLGRKLDEAEKKLELLLKDQSGEPVVEEFSLTPDASEGD